MNALPLSARGPISAAMLLLTLAIPGLLLAGAPLKGVDVKLGKNPGGSPAARTTDDGGKFDFGVLPAGSYALTLSLPAAPAATARSAKPSPAARPAIVLVEVTGAGDGSVRTGWDFQKSRRFDPLTESSARATAEEKIILQSDGHHPIQGKVTLR